MTDAPELEKTKPGLGGSWRQRRRFMLVVNLFAAAVIVYILATQQDTKVAETAVMMSFVTILGTLGSYVFGAVWDDKNKMEILGSALTVEDEYGYGRSSRRRGGGGLGGTEEIV